MKKYAVSLVWSWSSDDVREIIEIKGEAEILSLIRKSGRAAEPGTTPDEMIEQLCDLLRHNRLSAEEVFDLPDTVNIELEDGEEYDEDSIIDGICDEYGYYVDGCSFAEMTA